MTEEERRGKWPGGGYHMTGPNMDIGPGSYPEDFDMEDVQRRQKALRESRERHPSTSRVSRSRAEKQVRRWGIGFALWFAFCLILSLVFLGLMAWAIISIVNWVVSN